MKPAKQPSSNIEDKDVRMVRFNNTSEEEKELLTCDEVFCLYLGEVAK